MGAAHAAERFSEAMCTLADCLAMLEDSDSVTFYVRTDEGRDPVKVKLLDDYGIGSRNASFFVAGHEFGATHLIHAQSFESAWETWIDESPTIPEDELIEAYGIVDDYRATFIDEHGPAPDHWKTAEWDAWHEAFKAACRARLDELSHSDNPPELIEGYEYQSNASGTGIVDVGHYAWMNEVDPEHVTIERNAKDE